MQEVSFEPQPLNLVALNATLHAALGDALIGISVGSYGLRVHLSETATSQQVAQVKTIVLKHDPNQLTPEQAAEQQREGKLEQARESNAAPLDVTAYADPALRKLADKIAWLEQEIAALRGA